MKCNSCNNHEASEELHTCPYQEEFAEKNEVLEECNCCEFCEQNCAWDI